jgi:uncharacterized PurR-regulated membrane protein YhhQ (DUF165 family)
MSINRNILKLVPIVVFSLSAVLANVLTTNFGFVPIGFGLTATAGTYAAGFALVSRDIVHETSGQVGVVIAIIIGCGLSFVTANPAIAIASLVAFAFSEIADLFVYTPLRKNKWRSAVVCSSIVGGLIDTMLFIGIAFGFAALSPTVLLGQIVGKVLWVAVPFAIFGGALRAKRNKVA